MKLRLGFLASHGGSSMQAIYAATQAGQLDAEARVVISNNSQSRALAFARETAIPAYHLSLQTEQTADRLDHAICEALLTHAVQLVILSGYMKKLGPHTLAAYQDRIFNIHPALLPSYGGQGLYGDHVHAAVLAAGDLETGITIHLVDELYDHGRTIAQARVPVLPGDDVTSLAQRVKDREQTFFVEVLRQIATGELKVGL